MLEEIALTVSTVAFFLCSLIISGILPPAGETDGTILPCAAEVSEASGYDSCPDSLTERISLTGCWEGGGQILEFTPSGRVICGSAAHAYTLTDRTLTICSLPDGEPVNVFLIEPVDETTMLLDGVPMVRVVSAPCG